MFFAMCFPTVPYLALALYLSGVSGIVARNTLLVLLAPLLPHVLAEATRKLETAPGVVSLLYTFSRVVELLLDFRCVWGVLARAQQPCRSARVRRRKQVCRLAPKRMAPG